MFSNSDNSKIKCKIYLGYLELDIMTHFGDFDKCHNRPKTGVERKRRKGRGGKGKRGKVSLRAVNICLCREADL